MTDLGAYSIGTAINDLGQVAGYSNIYGRNQAFVTNSSGQKIIVGSLGGCCSDGAYGINASGQVTGEANAAKSNDLHAFTSDSNAQMVDLGTLGGRESWGYDINDSGQVTDYATTANGDQHAFVTADGVMKDLNLLLVTGTFDWVLNVGSGINNAGQITGSGKHNGLQSAFLLTPVVVPEPSVILLFASGLSLLAFTHRRKNSTWDFCRKV